MVSSSTATAFGAAPKTMQTQMHKSITHLRRTARRLNRRNTISSSELKDKIGDDDAKLLTTTVEDALAWLEAEGEGASTEDFEAKQKVCIWH